MNRLPLLILVIGLFFVAACSPQAQVTMAARTPILYAPEMPTILPTSASTMATDPTFTPAPPLTVCQKPVLKLIGPIGDTVGYTPIADLGIIPIGQGVFYVPLAGSFVLISDQGGQITISAPGSTDQTVKFTEQSSYTVTLTCLTEGSDHTLTEEVKFYFLGQDVFLRFK